MTKSVDDKVDIEKVQKTIWSKLSLDHSATQEEHTLPQANDLPPTVKYQMR